MTQSRNAFKIVRIAAVAVWVMASASRAAPTAGEHAALIERLGSRELAERTEAFNELAKQGRAPRQALRAAAAAASGHQHRLARLLLKQMPRWSDEDPIALRDMLANYEATEPELKADSAIRLLAGSEDRPIVDEALARIVLDEADEDVAWVVVALMPQSDRERIVRGPFVGDIALISAPQHVWVGLGTADPKRAVACFDRAIADARLVPARAYPTLIRAANELCRAAQSAGNAARELSIRRAVAVLGPPALADGAAPLPPAVVAYFEARLRLRTLDGYDEDLAALSIPSEHPTARLVAAVIRSSGPELSKAPMPFAKVPGLVLGVVDSIKPDEQLVAMDTLVRGGELGLVDAISGRLLSQLGPAPNGPLDMRRVQIYMLRYNVARASNDRAAAAQTLKEILGRMPEGVTVNRQMADGRWYEVPLTDLFAQMHVEQVREAIELGDDAAIQSRLDQLALVPISNSTIALDSIYLFETYGRLTEAEEVYAEYVASAFNLMERWEREGNDMAAEMYNNIAWFCARSGRNLQQSHRFAQRAVQMEPRQYGYVDTLAEVTFRLGDVAKAIDLEERALRAKPGDLFMTRQLARFKAGLNEGDAERALPSETWQD